MKTTLSQKNTLSILRVLKRTEYSISLRALEATEIEKVVANIEENTDVHAASLTAQIRILKQDLDQKWK